jgi:hypothetical protein
MFLFLNRLGGKRPVLATAVLFTIGGVATMLFLGLINWLLDGEFLYILNQIRAVHEVVEVRTKYVLAILDWVWSAPWLLVATMTFAFSCAYVLRHARFALKKIRLGESDGDPKILLFICCLANIVASFTYVGLAADDFPVLQLSYFADALYPFAYLTIGGALAVLIKPSGQTRQFWFLLAAALIALVPWVLATLKHIFPPRQDLFYGPILELSWIMAGSLLLLLLVQRPSRLTGGTLVMLFFSVVNLGAPTWQLGYPPNPAFKQQVLAVFDASRAVSRYNPFARARFWYDKNDPQATLLRGVASTYLWRPSLVNEEFPKLVAEGSDQSSVNPGERIFLLTSKNEDPVALANAAVSDQNLFFEQVARIAIHRPGVAFTIFVTDVKLDASKYEAIASSQPFSVELPSKIITPPQPYGYGAEFPLKLQDLIGPLWIRIQASVHRGPVSIGVLNEDGSDVVSRTVVDASGDTTVYLPVPKSQQFGNLLFQSWYQGKSADVTVEAITVFKPRPAVEDSSGKSQGSSK